MKINNNLLTKQLCNLLCKLFSKTIVYVVLLLDPLPLFSPQTHFVTQSKYVFKNKYGRLAHSL